MAEHVLDDSVTVNRWNRDHPARLTIQSGDQVTLHLPDSSGGQVQPDWTAATFQRRFDPAQVHTLIGPIAVDGAMPGDRLEVKMLRYAHRGWAWTALIPGLGLLAEEFPDPHLFIWKLEGGHTRSFPGVTLDLHPFSGVVGVQRAESGEYRTRAPGAFGGNLDVRHLTAGSTLWLPVLAPGAGLCAGDAHAAQGDGEVCINGMEAPMSVTMQINLIKGAALDGPQAITPGELVPPRYRTKPWIVFIESHENIREACRQVVRRAIAHLVGRLGITRELAYTLCSVVLDLKISQLVNQPVTTVSGYLPEAIFDE